ncbi:MAG: helix-hairpin-helix domain-containing protein [Phycisphaeraceae bacterium]
MSERVTPLRRGWGERAGPAARSAPAWRGTVQRRGVALLAVLWVVLVSGLVLMGVQQVARVHMAGGSHQLGAVQAHWLARAGVEHAMAELAADLSPADSRLDYWWDDLTFERVESPVGTYSLVSPLYDVGQIGLPRYGVEDLAGRLNVNTAGREQLEALESLDEMHASAILDWREQTTEARPGGAGPGYYQGLAIPYEIRGGELQTLHELLLVRGIDEELFWGRGGGREAMLYVSETRAAHFAGDPRRAEDLGLWRLATVRSSSPNVGADGQQRLDLSEASETDIQSRLNIAPELAEAIVEARDDEDFDSLFDLEDITAEVETERGVERMEIDLEWIAGRWDDLALSDDEHLPGRINVNTALWPVLLTVPGMDEAAADAIISHREGGAGGFESIGELLLSANINEDVFREVAEHLDVRSNTFRITAVGTSNDGVQRQIIAEVDRSGDVPRLVYWYQSP